MKNFETHMFISAAQKLAMKKQAEAKALRTRIAADNAAQYSATK